MAKIKYVSFYSSFYEAIKDLPDETRLKMYDLIMEYQFNGVEPDISSLTAIEKLAYTLIKPQLDASKQHFKDGCKGGRPPKEKQPVTETTASIPNKPQVNKFDTTGL